MNDFEYIGGVKFFTKDILEINISETDFQVILMDGTSVEYTQIPEERQAEVVMKEVGRIEFSGLIDSVIKDSPNNDVYVLYGCENVTVDADNGTMDFNNEIIGTDQDLITINNRTLPNGKIQYSKSNTLKLNKNDLYMLPNKGIINSINELSAEINE